MIESREGIRNLDEILSTGIDVLRIGAKDLSLDMGYGGVVTPEVKETVKEVCRRIRDSKVILGDAGLGGLTSQEDFDELCALGCRMFTVGSDMACVKQAVVGKRKSFDAFKQTHFAVMSDAVISACPRLKVIARHGSGVDTVDLESCRRHGVRVVNTRGSNSVAVAEHAMLLVLACAKTLNVLQDRYRAGQFKEARKLAAGVEISGKTLGVFGFGQIGRRVAAMAHDGFGMKILAFDPFCKPESVPDYVALVSDRDEIFDNADFITLHMAATAENKHGIGAREFARMKKTACLINTARGSLVDEAALIEALRAGEIAGAGLDATEPEPADVASPLFRMENVIMTPHCGGSTKESKSRSSLGAAKGCDEVLTGKPITSPVL